MQGNSVLIAAMCNSERVDEVDGGWQAKKSRTGIQPKRFRLG
jgi:hypothetical protein